MQLLAGLGRETLEAPQHRDVGAQAGERRAQFVAGVLHELMLLAPAARRAPSMPLNAPPSCPLRRCRPRARRRRAARSAATTPAARSVAEAPSDLAGRSTSRAAPHDGDDDHRPPACVADRVEGSARSRQRSTEHSCIATASDRDGQHPVGLAVDVDVAATACVVLVADAATARSMSLDGQRLPTGRSSTMSPSASSACTSICSKLPGRFGRPVAGEQPLPRGRVEPVQPPRRSSERSIDWFSSWRVLV